ncbi:MAG: AlpA family phage regulatory protein [Acidimicrobiaceae bacterium]|nr:AlpA family phage regulatory protein [Acidimicrobiaceae bacterium]
MKRDSRPQAPLLLSRAEVERWCGLSRRSLYRAMRQGEFPVPLRIGARAVRWRSDEIASWIEGRPRASGVVDGAA